MFARRQKRLFQLDPRLRLCASMVRSGGTVADIGTDHAYLPIWLARNGLVEKAIAADIHLGPLQKAAMNVKRHLVQDLVDTRLSDGLDQVFAHEADDIVMAGMGGETIAAIIQKAPWLKQKEKQLILQPMTCAKELREFLAGEGYAVREERAVLSDDRVYSVMRVEYDPQKVPSHPLYPYIGLLDPSLPESRQYIDRERGHLQKKADGLKTAGNLPEASRFARLADALQEFLDSSAAAF